MSPLNVNRVCNLEDFEDPELRDWIRVVFPYRVSGHPAFPRGQEDRKHWEIAIALLALLRGGALRPDAELLGLGAGVEPTLFWLTNVVRRVFATDRYLAPGDWEYNAPQQMLIDPPDDLYRGVWRRDRLVVQHMDARTLHYEDCSFDGIFSSGSIEHFGELEDISRALDEVHRVLKPGGVASISTEFGLDGSSPGSIPGLALFDREMIESIIVGDRDWELVDELTLELSPATRATELDVALPAADIIHARDRATGLLQEADVIHSEYPHVVLRLDRFLFTSVHVALRKRSEPATPARPAAAERPAPLARRLAAALPEPCVIVDGGVRWGFSEDWAGLGPHARLIGFDPDTAEIARLRAAHAGRPEMEFVALALGSRSETGPLNHYRSSFADSAFEHDERWLGAYAYDRSGDVVEEVRDVEYTTLDEWTAAHGVGRVDALKLDLQGGELEALRGATRLLGEVRAVEAEVVFNPIFLGAPLFGEVDAFLRERGFALWRLRDFAFYPLREGSGGRDRASMLAAAGCEPLPLCQPPGVFTWCNAHFVRTEAFQGDGPGDWETLLRDACIATALGFGDLALTALCRLQRAQAPAEVVALARAAVEEIRAGEAPGA